MFPVSRKSKRLLLVSGASLAGKPGEGQGRRAAGNNSRRRSHERTHKLHPGYFQNGEQVANGPPATTREKSSRHEDEISVVICHRRRRRDYGSPFSRTRDAAEELDMSLAISASYSDARSKSRFCVKGSACLARRRQRSACCFRVARSIIKTGRNQTGRHF